MTYKVKDTLFQDIFGQTSPLIKMENVLARKLFYIKRPFLIAKKSKYFIITIPIILVLRI